jgi:acyl carrier protein
MAAWGAEVIKESRSVEPTATPDLAPEPAVPPAAISEPEVRRKVIAAVAQALDLPESEVTPDASLEEELGAESLDFLDLAFMLERELQVRLPRLNLLQRAEERYGEGSLIQDGAVTGRGLALLAERMPEVRPERLRPGLRVSEIGRLVTAETFVRVVMELLAHKAALLASPCPECGGRLEASAVAPELTCGGCGATLPLPAGDEVLI